MPYTLLDDAAPAVKPQKGYVLLDDDAPSNHIPGGDPNVSTTPVKKDNLIGKAYGLLEVPATIVSGLAGQVAGGAASIYKGIGNPLTKEGQKDAAKYGNEIAEKLTYRPRTETGQNLTQGLSDVIHDSGIAGIPITGSTAFTRALAPATTAVSDVAKAAALNTMDRAIPAIEKIQNIRSSPASTMAGGGAALTDVAKMRAERAANLPVPINLTKGQATRDFEQQRFERETAKLPTEGAKLRDRYADQNDKVFQNFDEFTDMTGAQAPSLRATGKVVTEAIANKYNREKEKIKFAYDEARRSGDMDTPIDVQPVLNFVENNRSALKNAPILASIESEVKRLASTKGGSVDTLTNSRTNPSLTMSLNDTEELRKMIGQLSEPGTPNSVYGIQAKKLIDDLTEGQGGEKYQQARRMYENFSNEFKNTGVVDKLMRTKPGTKDRSVAYEDVFKHSVLDGALDDVRAIRKTLQTAGPEGEQAWKELQGRTVSHMKEQMFGNSSRDQHGNPVGSPAKLDAIVKNLDADGKLEFIFGKKGAQQIRDVNDLAKDVYTAPPGSVNTSNTSSVLIGLLDTALSGTTGVPLPIGTAINYGVKRSKAKALSKKIDESLSPVELKNLLTSKNQKASGSDQLQRLLNSSD